MAGWKPGVDPFPTKVVTAICEFRFLDELKLVRHAEVHLDKVPQSLWQLAGDFRAAMTVSMIDGTERNITIKAPRGLYTDLASVPEALWSIVGPIGPHLEASIVHDYLYMGWTDFRDKALKRDWNFADAVFEAGMDASDVDPFDRKLIITAVRVAGWSVFRKKSYSLKRRMDEWLPLLERSHSRDEPSRLGSYPARKSSAGPRRRVGPRRN